MKRGERPTASYLVRVVAGDGGDRCRITVQNLKSGKMRTFEAWSEFVAFAQAQPKPGSLK